MKKSKIILLTGSILLPLVLFSGLGAQIRKNSVSNSNNNSINTNNETDFFENIAMNDSNSKQLLNVIDNKQIQVGQKFTVDLSALESKIEFDSKLINTGYFSLKCSENNQESFVKNASEKQLEINASHKKLNSRCYAEIRLPAKLEKLTINNDAGICNVISRTPVEIADLKLSLNAGKADFNFSKLNTEELKLESNSGKTKFNAESLSVNKEFAVENNSGKTDISFNNQNVNNLKSGSKFKFENNAGKLSINMKSVNDFHMNAENTIGSLIVTKNRDKIIELNGMNGEKTYNNGKANTIIQLENNVGSLDVNIN